MLDRLSTNAVSGMFLQYFRVPLRKVDADNTGRGPLSP
jgi:hypothetical protein